MLRLPSPLVERGRGEEFGRKSTGLKLKFLSAAAISFGPNLLRAPIFFGPNLLLFQPHPSSLSPKERERYFNASPGFNSTTSTLQYVQAQYIQATSTWRAVRRQAPLGGLGASQLKLPLQSIANRNPSSFFCSIPNRLFYFFIKLKSDWTIGEIF